KIHISHWDKTNEMSSKKYHNVVAEKEGNEVQLSNRRILSVVARIGCSSVLSPSSCRMMSE
ncbi:MAG: hypothetical protein OEM90_20610, partial [Desulfobacteraceae bacterium]|nr:hypothetical protein [Desulfobacteraceae bacterium]